MDDEELLTSLGANVVDQSDFEQKFLNHLEERLKEVEAEEQALKQGSSGDGKGPSNLEGNVQENSGVDVDDIPSSGRVIYQSPSPQENILRVGESTVQEQRHEEKESTGEKHVHYVASEGPGDILKRALLADSGNFSSPKSAASSSKSKKPEVEKKEETEQERKIRNGEMTPFGFEIAPSSPSSSKSRYVSF